MSQPANPYEGDTQVLAAHPGNANYAPVDASAEEGDTVVASYNGGELIGFRLPEKERPDHTEEQAQEIVAEETTPRHAATSPDDDEVTEAPLADSSELPGLDLDDPDGTRNPGN